MSRPPGTLLPILHEADWSGRELAVCRPLFGKEPREHVPFVAFSYDDDRKRYTVTRTGLHEEKRMPDEVEAEALTNLRRRSGHWEVTARDEAGHALALSLVDEYAASFILHEPLMAEAAVRLRCDRVRVAMPSRGLMVTRAWAGEPMPAEQTPADPFGEWASDAYRKAFETRVSPATFVVQAASAEAVEVESVVAPRVAKLEQTPETLHAERYDDAERRLIYRHTGGAPTPGELQRLREIDARGRAAPGQPVDEVWVVFEGQEQARRYAALVESAGAVPAVYEDGEPVEYDD